MEPLSINCIVSGDRPNQIFRVKISPNEIVDALKEIIKEKKSIVYADTDGNDIQHFKVSLCPADLEQARDPGGIDGAQELSMPLDLISDHFQDLEKCHVHVIVLPPTSESHVAFTGSPPDNKVHVVVPKSLGEYHPFLCFLGS
jgi:hypothetical protein